MADFFEQFLSQKKSLTTSLDFIKEFDGINSLFVHALELNDNDLKLLNSSSHSVVHSPVSNRLLNNTKLDFENFKINLCIGTDGLSSNISLSMFDELRSALMSHYNIDLNILSKKLLTMATKNGAQGLRLNSGELAIGKDSDIIAIDSFEPNNLKTIYTDIILHTQKVSKTIINGNTTGTIIA